MLVRERERGERRTESGDRRGEAERGERKREKRSREGKGRVMWDEDTGIGTVLCRRFNR